MRSILDKALAALLEGNHTDADKLFHDFVLERARSVNESIVETGGVDVDSIVDEGDEFVDDEKVTGMEKSAFDSEFSDDLGDSIESLDDVVTNSSESCDGAYKAGRNAALDGESTTNPHTAGSQEFADWEEGFYDFAQFADDEEPLSEGKSFKRGAEDDANAKKKKEQERKAGAKQKSEIEEGKTFKRGEEDAADKKKTDQERKDASKKKREVTESAKKFYIKSNGINIAGPFDTEYEAEKELAKLLKKAKPADEMDDAKIVNEGKLEITQAEDGTLNMTHHVSTPTMPAPIPTTVAPVAAPLALPPVMPADEFDMESDMDFDTDPLPGVEELSDETAFESLKESLADQLEKIIVKTKDGEFAVGGSTKQENHSPVPNVAGDKRLAGAPVKTKQVTTNGFDKPAVPKVAVSKLATTPVQKAVTVPKGK